MQGAQADADQLRRNAVRECGGEIAFEIVSHLGFDLHTASHVESRAAAHSDKIYVRMGRGQVEVVGKSADLDVVV